MLSSTYSATKQAQRTAILYFIPTNPVGDHVLFHWQVKGCWSWSTVPLPVVFCSFLAMAHEYVTFVAYGVMFDSAVVQSDCPPFDGTGGGFGQ